MKPVGRLEPVALDVRIYRTFVSFEIGVLSPQLEPLPVVPAIEAHQVESSTIRIARHEGGAKLEIADW